MSYTAIADGIYKDSRTGNFYWRPRQPNGKPTYRKLNAATLALARIRFREERSKLDQGSPLQIRRTVGEILTAYKSAGCPDRKRKRRDGRQLYQEEKRVEQLLKWWEQSKVESVSQRVLDSYADYRMKNCKGHGGRAVDIEVNTLRNAFRYAVRAHLIPVNPLASPVETFARSGKEVRHCRDCAPGSGDELHSIAAYFFESKKSEVLGWLTFFQALTGCRISELTALRLDAGPQEPGHVSDGILWLARRKGGVNNFFSITPELRDCLDHFRQWHISRYPVSPMFFPSPYDQSKAVDECALTRGLARAATKLGVSHRTSHGLRSYYVTVRRGQGAHDGIIALEIGQRTGGKEILKVYGDALPVKLSWLPSDGKEPVWKSWSDGPGEVGLRVLPSELPLRHRVIRTAQQFESML